MDDAAVTGTAGKNPATERGCEPHGAAKPPHRLKHGLDSIVETYTAPWHFLAAFTLAVTLGSPPRGAPLATQLLAVLGLLMLRRIATDWRFWALLTAVTSLAVANHPLVDLDNHHFLHLYWLLAFTAACLSSDPAWTLGRAGRLMIGWLFFFATLWKILSPDFIDGSFFTYLLVHDTNVSRVGVALQWQGEHAPWENGRAMANMRDDPSEVDPVDLQVDPTIERVARPLSALTLVLEGAVALAFLLPLRGRWTRLREGTLFAFIVVTYPVLPVLSFAALLLAMNLATSDLPHPRAEVLHLAVYLVAAGAWLGLTVMTG
jgi:hypothetical protein